MNQLQQAAAKIVTADQINDRWIVERARVLSSEQGALWVAADKSSACGKCSVKTGCGTSLLASMMTKEGDHEVAVRALLPHELAEQPFAAGQFVELAIDKNAFVKTALVMYLIPLAGLLAGVVLGSGRPEAVIALMAITGLFLGGWLASIILQKWRNCEHLQPTVLRRVPSSDQLVVAVR